MKLAAKKARPGATGSKVSPRELAEGTMWFQVESRFGPADGARTRGGRQLLTIIARLVTRHSLAWLARKPHVDVGARSQRCVGRRLSEAPQSPNAIRLPPQELLLFRIL